MHDPVRRLRADRLESDDEVSLRDLGGTLRRHRGLILGITAAVLAVVAVYTLLVRPTYEGEATVQVVTREQGSEGMLAKLEPLASLDLPGMGGSEITTEIGVLSSRRIAEAVVDSLHLQVQLRTPRTPRDSVLTVLSVARWPVAGTYTLRLQPEGSYAVTLKPKWDVDLYPSPAPPPPLRLPSRIRIGHPVQLGGLVVALVPALRRQPPEEIRFTVRPFQATMKDFADDLLVERQDDRSKLIEVSYRTHDRRLAAAVPNAVAANYIEYKSATSNTETRSTVAVLREKIADYKQRLQAAEDRMRSFREQQQVVSPEEQAKQQVERVGEVQTRLDQMQVERRSLARLLQEVDQATRTTGSRTAYRQIGTFPSFLGNPSVQSILQALSQLEEQRSQLLLRRTPNNDEVRRTEERTRELEMQLHRFATNYLESLDNQIASAQTAVAGFGDDLQRIPARELEFARLARDQKMLDTVYTVLQARLTQAEIKQAVDLGDARVVDQAFVPDKPASPKPLANLVLGTVLGLMLGVAAAVGREMVNTTIRSREDAEQAADGVPVLGAIPAALPRRRHFAVLPRGPARALGDGNGAGDPRLVTRQYPSSRISEAYRSLRTTFTAGRTGVQSVVVTSAMPGEGTSAVATNLAITLAQQGGDVLLIDADLRQGTLHTHLAVRQEPGLADILLGGSPLVEAVQEVRAGPRNAVLHVLSCGEHTPEAAEILGSERMLLLMEELKQRHDWVVFNAPPLNLVTDAAVLGSVADTTLLVACIGKTRKETLQEATLQLHQLGVPMGGVVLSAPGAGEGHGSRGD